MSLTTVREILVNYKPSPVPRTMLTGPHQVAEAFRSLQVDNSREQLMVFYLDGATSVIAYSIASIGTATASIAHPREVFQGAIHVGAVSLIIAHNHPSGGLTPSKEDIALTKRLVNAGSLIAIRLLDHVIVTEFTHYSMKESDPRIMEPEPSI